MHNITRRITSGQTQVILATLPCGACSKAREIPASKNWRGPAASKSSQYPRGLPSLSGLELLKFNKRTKSMTMSLSPYGSAATWTALTGFFNTAMVT